VNATVGLHGLRYRHAKSKLEAVIGDVTRDVTRGGAWRSGEPYAFGAWDDEVGGLSGPWDFIKDGIHHPRWVSNPEGTWRAAVKALDVNVPLHDSVFARPSGK
jgi:hypothetical protein